jgi:hypothetical protein
MSSYRLCHAEIRSSFILKHALEAGIYPQVAIPSSSWAEKEILAERLTQARMLYTRYARGLDGLSGATFDKAYQQAENARLAYESARRALAAHTDEHGC